METWSSSVRMPRKDDKARSEMFVLDTAAGNTLAECLLCQMFTMINGVILPFFVQHNFNFDQIYITKIKKIDLVNNCLKYVHIAFTKTVTARMVKVFIFSLK